jgi:peptidoglycan hydrolase-like protein with peptidoglycan-binding domain
MKKIFLASLLGLSLIIFGPSKASAAEPACYKFARNLTLGSTGEDVKALQQLLNAQGILVSTSGAGSKGQETTLFGTKTKLALSKFQANWKISPAVGYFGPVSRGAVKLICTSTVSTGTGNATTTVIDPVVIPIAPAPIVVPPPAPAIPPSVINPTSVVGILCLYDYRGAIQLMKGSGVIVNPEGYILTARHIVDPRYTLRAYSETLDAEQKDLYSNATLRSCQIGLPENISSLPSADVIRTLNPSSLISRNFQYAVQTYFVPSETNLVEAEYRTADVAVLKVIGPTPTCSFTSRLCDLTNNFPYTPVSTIMPEVGTEILSYGYPVEASINESGNQFYDFYLKGAVGNVGIYVGGTQHFLNEPMSFSFQAQDIQNGRSGSPLFWKGKVIGILFGSTVGSTQESYNLALSAISRLLHEANLDQVLRTQ